MVYTLRFFSSKCSLFHNSNIFGSCIIHILYTGCAKIKKNNSGAKRLILPPTDSSAAFSPNIHVLLSTYIPNKKCDQQMLPPSVLKQKISKPKEEKVNYNFIA